MNQGVLSLESLIADVCPLCLIHSMSDVLQLREAVSHLSAPDRAELAAFLLGSLEETHHWVDDEEVLRRRQELESGAVRGLTWSEFKKACGR